MKGNTAVGGICVLSGKVLSIGQGWGERGCGEELLATGALDKGGARE